MSKITVVGLGYVGLPLAAAFGCKGHEVVGFDVKREKLEQLKKGIDVTGEVDKATLQKAKMEFSDDPSKISSSEFVVVAVPTPVDNHNVPDLTPLEMASKTIAPHLKNNCIVIYESTVYPGVTEEVCLPILKEKGQQGVDFRIGYSPERINPGDREHTIDKIVKVVSGQDEETLDAVAKLYETVVDAGVHRAESIMVAEAAKVIENTQRDLNIALMNELSLIFDRMGIRTRDVLRAALTKWNFLNFYPGLVGGHCIGVDPYYLTYRAESLGYNTQVITAGRRINDNMGKFVADKTIKLLINNDVSIKGARVLVLGMTFKENVPDFRNSKVVDVVQELQDYQIEVLTHDPFWEENTNFSETQTPCVSLKKIENIDAVILAVPHDAYLKLSKDLLRSFFNPDRAPVCIDIPAALTNLKLEDEGFVYWQL